MPHATTLDPPKRDATRRLSGFGLRSGPRRGPAPSAHRSRIAWSAGITLVVCAAAAAMLLRTSTSASMGAREIRLVIRDMAYYAEGQPTPNPTLHIRRGEQVRIVLRNDDAGMSHDFAIRAWNRGTGIVTGQGDAAVEFTAPQTAGEEAYACTPHGEVMRGTIRIE